jgi:hypothetical protein
MARHHNHNRTTSRQSRLERDGTGEYVFRKVSYEEQEKGKPFTIEQLAQWGVDYPPRKGWRTALARGEDPNVAPHPKGLAVQA